MKNLSKSKKFYIFIVTISLFLVVVGISFGYLIDESKITSWIYKATVQLNVLDDSGKEIYLLPKESRTIPISIKNKSEIDLEYKLYFEGENSQIDIFKENIGKSIKFGEEKKTFIKVNNKSNVTQVIFLGIISGTDEKKLNVIGTEIEDEYIDDLEEK